MWILNLFLFLSVILGLYLGFKPFFMLERLNRSLLLNSILIVLAVFTLLMFLHVFGYFPQSIAAPFMMLLYSTLAGFFGGYGYRLIRLRKDGGKQLYQHRSFWIDHAPNILAIILILFGLYRTAVITDLAVTGLRITSGLSLIGFGFLIWTLKVVPEFRSGGIVLFDRFIAWDEVIAWRWISEKVIGFDYLSEGEKTDERIREFLTSIPEDEKREVEKILSSKMDEFSESRNKKLFKENDE